MTNTQRDRVAHIALEMFVQGHSATDVCRRFGVAYTTLKHLCHKSGVTVPKIRGAQSRLKKAEMKKLNHF